MLNMQIEIFGVVKSDDGLRQIEAAALYCDDMSGDFSPERVREYVLDLASSVKPLVMNIEAVEGDMSELRACLRNLGLGYRCSFAAADEDYYDKMFVYGPTLGEEVLVDLEKEVPKRDMQSVIDELMNATPTERAEHDRRDLINFLRGTDAGINFDVEMSEKYGVVRKNSM